MDSSTNPGYLQSLSDIYNGFLTYLKDAKYSNGNKFLEDFDLKQLLFDFTSDLTKYVNLSVFEIVLPIIIALLFTLIRYLLTVWIFKPFAKHMKLKEVNAKKLPESCWKFLYYLVICCYLLYVVIYSPHYHYYYQPYEIWKDYHSLKEVPTLVGVAFLLEFSYYLHSLYGTIYIDLWRKDSSVMIFHHLLCLSLIGFSYAVRYHKAGLLLMFVHDFSDIFLEFAKCQVYLKYRAGRYIVWHDVAGTISFGFFALSWFVGRLYWFPIIVLRSCSFSSLFNGPTPPAPFYFIFNILLSFMFILNIYWFFLILMFLYKVLSGQMKDLDDIRDYDVDKKLKNTTINQTNGRKKAVANNKVFDLLNGKFANNKKENNTHKKTNVSKKRN